jgi:hypothetical protein
MAKRVAVLAMTVCTLLFGATATLSAEEGPRAKRGKLEVGKQEQATDTFTLKRPGKTVGKWRTMQRFGTPSKPSFMKNTVNDCWGVCDCTDCYCESDEGVGCCIDGCEACWGVLDEGGGCLE